MMDLVRAGDTPPVRSPPGMGDHPSAMGFYSAIVTALYRREKTGKGAHVGSSLLANGLWANACSVQSTLCGDIVEHHPARVRPSDAVAEHLPAAATANGWRSRSCTMTAAGRCSARRCSRRCSTIRGFRPRRTARQHAKALTSTLDKIFAERTAAEWGAILDKNDVVFGAVYAMADVPNDEQAKIAGALVPMEDGSMTVSSPFWIEGEDKIKARRAPAIGQHNDEVLAAAGFSTNDIQKLRGDGIVG